MPLIPRNRDHGWAPYVWLVFLSFYFFQPVLDPHTTPRDWVITVVATITFLVLYFRVFWMVAPWNYFALVAMAVMGLVLGHMNVGASVFVIFAASFVPWVTQNSRRALIGLGVIIAALAIDAWVFHAPIWFWANCMVVSIGVGLSNTHFAERNRADKKLRMAQTEIEHLAKVAERERIARDLHDVLGHTLTLISVKSTLAAKLLDKDLEKARGEIADIERVSRQAIADIRSTVRGYSTYKLSEELQRAKSALESAGVAVKAETADMKMSPAQESVAALIMREAVTNVVRHAHARHCQLRIGQNNGTCVLEIQDDGCGGIHADGNGLRGMRERIEALGGAMTRDGSSGMKLRFEFPLAQAAHEDHESSGQNGA
jgi:two-component system sensor histidine kinase DesK